MGTFSLRLISKLGKFAGIDGLAAEHFVYSHERISARLAMLFTSLFTSMFTSMFTHGYLPNYSNFEKQKR